MSEHLPPSKTLRLDADGEPEKRCSRCHDWWPADLEFFYASKTGPAGVGNWCRACYHETAKAQYSQEKGRPCP